MIILGFILAVCIAIIFWCLVMLVKCCVTFRNFRILDEAIFLYNIGLISKGIYNERIPYEREKSYNTVMYNLFDWGYKNILPPEDFEKVKPFIKEVLHNGKDN